MATIVFIMYTILPHISSLSLKSRINSGAVTMATVSRERGKTLNSPEPPGDSQYVDRHKLLF